VQVESRAARSLAAEVSGSWYRSGTLPTEAITALRKRAAASRAAQVPGVSAATWSASAASRAATPAGMRGGLGGGWAWCPPPPQPARSAALDAVSKAQRQRIRQPPLADLVLGQRDLVLDTAVHGSAGVEVDQQPRGARVAVARLADRARVEQPAARAERGLGAVGREPAVQDVVRQRDRERYVAVSDEHDPRLRQLERRGGCLGRQHVLPDRVARTGVEELDAVAPAQRLLRLQELPRALGQHAARPARGLDRVAGELRQVDRPEHAEIVVPGEADRRTPLDRRAAGIRARPVADEVAEAPELVRLLPLDLREDGLEGVPVSVDV